MINSELDTQDTIVAPATPPGSGGIAIVRVSGKETERIGQTLLGRLPAARSAVRAEFKTAEGALIDTGIALYFPRPASFTGESVLEMHCHGGPIVVDMLVAAAIALGARRAEPGEFSKRAFLNDKLDLTQAEAIADLIDSGTAQAARAALRSLSGDFSRAIQALQERLTTTRLHVEAAIDFPEEEIDFLSDQQLSLQLDDCGEAFRRLTDAAQTGRLLRDGLQMVIVGRPNAGKSSLLNTLSGQEAAIVTEIAGTTRDILRERIEIDGLTVELVDTAGLREDPDLIEAEGIRRARAALKNTDAALWIQDASNVAANNEDLVEQLPKDTPMIVVRNKTDLTKEAPGRVCEDPLTINISATAGSGIDTLRDAIRELSSIGDLGEGAFTARRRHVEALHRALQHFEHGRQLLQDERAGELLAEELKAAHQALGEITGTISSDELLGKIFAEFCIGK